MNEIDERYLRELQRLGNVIERQESEIERLTNVVRAFMSAADVARDLTFVPAYKRAEAAIDAAMGAQTAPTPCPRCDAVEHERWCPEFVPEAQR